VSDADRDRAIAVLREGSAAGRLSQETFVRRVEAALCAKHADDLAALISDLPTPVRSEGLAGRAVSRCSALAARLQAAWRGPRIPRLVLPRGRDVFTIGRARDCDLALPDMTVSWRHAELRRAGGEWLLVDVGSTNGTRANGWRVGDGFTVRAGDCVSFGRATFRLADHA
jgi:FHA domain/DUF1707 SHOCT-like domain